MPELRINYKPVGMNGTVAVTADLDGTVLAADQIEIGLAADRERFCRDLCDRRPGINRAAVSERLLAIAVEHLRRADKTAGTREKSGVSSADGTQKQVLREPPAAFIPFPVAELPEPVRSYVTEAAEAVDCDESYIALPLLAALAAAIGNTRRVRLKVGWVEACVLWCVIVGNSGSMKSPAIELSVRAIRRRQNRLFKEHAKAMAEYAAELSAWKAKPKGDRGEEPEKPAPCVRLWCSDVTVEALAARLLDAWRGLLAVRDELSGLIGGMNAYKSRGTGADQSAWLEMYGGRNLLVDRKTGDRPVINVPRASVSITGGIQPGILSRALTDEFFENGFAARLLLANPPRRVKRWTDREVDPVLQDTVDKLFAHLLDLRPVAGIDGDPEPVDVPLTSSAQAVWVEFVNAIGREQHSRGEERLIAAWSKLEGAAARIALIIHQVRHAAGDADVEPFRIDEQSVRSGITLARWFGHETERVYVTLRETDEERAARELCDWIANHGGEASARQLARNLRRFRNTDEAEAALKILVDSGRGSWHMPPGPGPAGGRPADRSFRLGTTGSADKTYESQADDLGFVGSDDYDQAEREAVAEGGM